MPDSDDRAETRERGKLFFRLQIALARLNEVTAHLDLLNQRGFIEYDHPASIDKTDIEDAVQRSRNVLKDARDMNYWDVSPNSAVR